MNAMIQPIIESLRLSNFVVDLQTAGLTDDQARTQPNSDQGASIAWILGHLCDYRVQMANVFGAGQKSAYRAFATESASEIEHYPTLSQILADWKRISDALIEILEGVSDEQLLASVPDENPGGHGEKRMLDAVIFFPWHESYHLGAVGRIRTELGLKPTSELAMAAMQGE